MHYFLPPYRKSHIITFGGILLFILVSVIWMNNNQSENNNRKIFQVTKVNAAAVKDNFKAPLAKAQAGNYDQAWSHDRFLILDVRPKADYDSLHIKGALSAPLNQLQYAALDPATDLVVYSTNKEDITKAVATLKANKIEHVFTLVDSLENLSKSSYLLLSSEKEPAE